jgi:DnaK suppressor protein
MNEQRARELLAAERRRVEDALGEVRAALGRAERESVGELGDVDQHQADRGTELHDREEDESRERNLEDELAAIARAERRLEEGTFGRSVESGAPIPDERLEVVPWAERTVEEETSLRRTACRRPARAPRTCARRWTTWSPPDPAAIPLARDVRDVTYDPQEVSGEVDFDIPGAVYATEGAAPEVGEPEADDRAVERAYRPESEPTGAGWIEQVRPLVDSGRLEAAPRASAAAASTYLRRARRHLASAERLATEDRDGALAAALLASRHALLALLGSDGLRLRTASADTVAAYAEAALPDPAGQAAAELEEDHELMAARGLEVTAGGARSAVARARRVVDAAAGRLDADEGAP